VEKINNGSRDIAYEPSSVILAQGIDILTSEERLFNAVAEYSADVLQTRIARDSHTNTSLGFAFVDFDNANVSVRSSYGLLTYKKKKKKKKQTAQQMLTKLYSKTGTMFLPVDGKTVQLSFGSVSYDTIKREKKSSTQTKQDGWKTSGQLLGSRCCPQRVQASHSQTCACRRGTTATTTVRSKGGGPRLVLRHAG